MIIISSIGKVLCKATRFSLYGSISLFYKIFNSKREFKFIYHLNVDSNKRKIIFDDIYLNNLELNFNYNYYIKNNNNIKNY